MKEKLPFIILLLVGLLMILQALKAQGALGQELDEVKVLGVGLGLNKETQAGNYSTLSGFEVRELGTNHISEVLNRLAGFNIQHGSGQEHLTAIRSPVLTGGAGAGSFLFLEDSVPLRAAGFGNVNALFEAMPEFAEAIEAVRGPSSALYGSNAVHGAVNVLSRAPTLQRQADIILRFGLPPFSSKLIASLSNRVGRESAARLSFSYLHDSGWRVSTGVKQFKGQLRLDNTFGKARSKTLISIHRLNQETGGYLVDNSRTRGTEGINFSYRFRALTKTNADPDAFRKAYAVRAQNNILWRFDDNKQLDFTSWFRWTKINFLMHFLPGSTPIENNAHYSVGVRPIWHMQARAAGNWDFNFGAEFEYTHGSLSEEQSKDTDTDSAAGKNQFRFVKGTHYDYLINAYTLALFTQNDWQLPDENTTITVGVRGEWVRYDYDNKTASGVPAGADINGTEDKDLRALYRPDDRVDDFLTASPKVGLNYRLPKAFSHQAYIFTNYTHGQRAPQTTDLYRLLNRDRNAKFRPERLESVELGFRGKHKAIQWQLTGFFMDKQNHHFRSSSFAPVTNGKTRHAGVELDFLARFGLGISLQGALSYAHHWYNFDRAAAKITKGDNIDSAPRLLLNLELAYTHHYGKLAIEYIRVGKYYTDPENEHSYRGHNVVNLRASARVWRDIHVFFNIFNLTDGRYADRADFAFGNNRYFPGQPRSFYVGLKADF